MKFGGGGDVTIILMSGWSSPVFSLLNMCRIYIIYINISLYIGQGWHSRREGGRWLQSISTAWVIQFGAIAVWVLRVEDALGERRIKRVISLTWFRERSLRLEVFFLPWRVTSASNLACVLVSSLDFTTPSYSCAWSFSSSPSSTFQVLPSSRFLIFSLL